MTGDAITADTFYRELKHRFSELLENEGILKERVDINTRSLTPEEAIGITERRDFPIITGKDVMVQAECMGALGQAFTDAPSVYRGTLKDICALDIETDSHDRGLFIAALNAVIGYQPSLLERLSGQFPLRAADLSPVNIGQTRYGVLVEDGGAPGVSQSICSWADLVLCTGSTVCNGSIVDFLYLKDKILFYGTTLAGAAALLGLPRLCFADRYQ